MIFVQCDKVSHDDLFHRSWRIVGLTESSGCYGVHYLNGPYIASIQPHDHRLINPHRAPYPSTSIQGLIQIAQLQTESSGPRLYAGPT